ncbi:MAG TPA: universal stress protein [Gemmatimonadales bacterium]|jgi:nucleotide-binding universal stress UspA family protein|nr:universal stress protein [Gemmatimonadales bacterium]
MGMQRGFRSILVPLDGYPLAEEALPVAETLARRCGATLHLVTVEPPTPLVLASDVAAVAQEMQDDTARAMRAYLQRAAAKAGRNGCSAASALLAGGPAERIAAYARQHRIELVVMTTHGRGGLSRLCVGSVAERLLRTLEVPMLLLRPREGPQPTEYRRILAAIGERAELELIEPALTLGGLAGTTSYVLAHVVEEPPAIVAALPWYVPHVVPLGIQARQSEARHYLGPLAERLSQHGVVTEAQVTVGGPVAAELLGLARTAGADLIAIGTHRRRGLERVVLGSVARELVRRSDVPVLITPLLTPADHALPPEIHAGFTEVS